MALPGNNLKKCRARYGLDQQNQWCKPCRWVLTRRLFIIFRLKLFKIFKRVFTKLQLVSRLKNSIVSMWKDLAYLFVFTYYGKRSRVVYWFIFFVLVYYYCNSKKSVVDVVFYVILIMLTLITFRFIL